MILCFKRYFGSTNVSMIKAKFISRRFTKLLIVLDGLKARGLIKNILDGRFVKLTINDHRSIVWCLKEKRGKKKCNSVLYLQNTRTRGWQPAKNMASLASDEVAGSLTGTNNNNNNNSRSWFDVLPLKSKNSRNAEDHFQSKEN